jgi:BMFP domain-containing protein YqiC
LLEMAPKMAKRKYEETFEELLDIVSRAREELVAVERKLERLRAEIAKAQEQNNGPRTRR